VYGPVNGVQQQGQQQYCKKVGEQQQQQRCTLGGTKQTCCDSHIVLTLFTNFLQHDLCFFLAHVQ